jgi:hypothetical protein
VLTTEELRVAALAASAKRGKWVAKRRVMWRWFAWVNWTYVLPSIGFLTVLAAAVCFIFWQYWGAEQAYSTTQTWMQNQFGVAHASPSASPPASTTNTVSTTSTASTAHAAIESVESSMLLKTTLRLSMQLSSPKTEPESTKP